MIIIGILLFLVIPRSPRIIDVADAKQYIGKTEEVRVRAYIDNVQLFPDVSPRYIMLYGENFFVQVGPLDNPANELSRYDRFKEHCVIIGPAPIVAVKTSGNPKIKLSSNDALSYITDKGPGRCK